MTTPAAGTPPVLIVDQQAQFRTWNISQIYNPVSNPTAQYVPNVNDLVIDWTAGFFQVSAVNYSTGVSTLTPWSPPQSSVPGSNQSVLLGDTPGVQYESFRAYIDTTTTPYTLAMDARLHLYGTAVSYIKVFYGTDISQNGTVISQMYDQAGNFLGENIPTELVAMPDGNNLAIQCPQVGYTLTQVADGDALTIVAYTSAGTPVFTAPVLAKNTRFIRSTNAATKYITGIALETPFLSESDPKLIQYPINMPVEQLNLIGVVTYSDGTSARLPVDGTKFAIWGLENFTATISGQTIPVVLRYMLSPGEVNYMAAGANQLVITASYSATTLQQDGAYSVKLFGYPVWQDPINGYYMDWWLYTLDRDEVYHVTPYVQAASNSPAFNPLLYGTLQNLTVAINMSQVDPKFANYRHVQTTAVSLLAPGNQQGQTDWTIQFAPGQTPPYGLNTAAVLTMINQNNWTLGLASGFQSLQQWLTNVYFNTLPLYNTFAESAPPTPNFFTLIVGGQAIELPVSQWNQPISIPGGIAQGQLVYLQFFQRSSSGDLQLGCSAMQVNVITPGN
jgi:hypothetical protein